MPEAMVFNCFCQLVFVFGILACIALVRCVYSLLTATCETHSKDFFIIISKSVNPFHGLEINERAV